MPTSINQESTGDTIIGFGTTSRAENRNTVTPPKNLYIPPAFLQQVVSSGKPTSTSSPQPESSDFRMSHVSLSNAPDDTVCIAHGEPISGDFKQFLENHPDMDFYDVKRKFKEEQKAKQKVRQGPKLSH